MASPSFTTAIKGTWKTQENRFSFQNVNSNGPDRRAFIYFPSFSKNLTRYHVSFKNGMTEKINIEQSVIAYVIDARLPLRSSITHKETRDPQGRVGTHYPLHSSRSNQNTEVVTKRLRVDAHFKGNITSTQCFESSRIEKR